MTITIRIETEGFNEVDEKLHRIITELIEHVMVMDWYESFDMTLVPTVETKPVNPPQTELGMSAASVLRRIRRAN